ncbi:MAG: lipocalin-like domain-containing protein [Oceanipulchritudo sp.]
MKTGYIIPLVALATFPAGAVPEFTADGFRVPQPGATLPFPASHGAHPEFKIEWWYITGHLRAETGERFGYQATFFRSGLEPRTTTGGRAFGRSQLHLTHMALSDEAGGRFLYEERLARDGWDAGAAAGRLEVRNGNWRLEGANPDVTGMQLQASIRSEAAWTLQLRPAKPLVRFGPDGTSRKGPEPEARSYYLSFTRLETSGTLTIGDQTLAVTGSSWMDHEIASNQLDPDYTGWDWIAIQLKDGWEVKAYLLRQSDGTPAPYSALIWIDPEGRTTYRGPEAFSWDKSRHWNSPESGAVYPNAPVIRTLHPLSNREVVFRFEPVLENQELALPGTTYWEGAGRILDQGGETVGSGYLELVGYAGEIQGLR